MISVVCLRTRLYLRSKTGAPALHVSFSDAFGLSAIACFWWQCLKTRSLKQLYRRRVGVPLPTLLLEAGNEPESQSATVYLV